MKNVCLYERIGNQVRILSIPDTVFGERTVRCHCGSEKGQRAVIHKPGDLLNVMIGNLPMKVSCPYIIMDLQPDCDVYDGILCCPSRKRWVFLHNYVKAVTAAKQK